jgi:conserved oligomeric Golgi complex subunit 6
MTMQAHSKAAFLQISRSIGETDLVQSRREQINAKHSILVAFRLCFNLPEEQILLLTAASAPMDERFFDAFERAKTIHSNCQSLLTTENSEAAYE